MQSGRCSNCVADDNLTEEVEGIDDYIHPGAVPFATTKVIKAFGVPLINSDGKERTVKI